MTADHITGKLENIISGHQINADDAAWLRGLVSAPAEGDATLTEEQIDRFIPERIGVRNWGKPEQADLFNRGQVRDAIRTAIASQPNVQPKAAEVDAAPWSKTVESAALLLQRCTGLELQDCENLAGTILGMAANVQPKGTANYVVSIVMTKPIPAGTNTQNKLYGVEAVSPDEAHGKAIALAQADFPEHQFHTACHWLLQAPAPAPEVPAGMVQVPLNLIQRAQQAINWHLEPNSPAEHNATMLELSSIGWPGSEPPTQDPATAPDDFAAHTVLSGVARRKVADMIASGYRICGYTMERDGHRSAVVFDAAWRWLDDEQRHTLMFVEGSRVQVPAVGADDARDAAKYRHWRDHAETLCVELRYEPPAWIDAYLAEALAERVVSHPPVKNKEQP